MYELYKKQTLKGGQKLEGSLNKSVTMADMLAPGAIGPLFVAQEQESQLKSKFKIELIDDEVKKRPSMFYLNNRVDTNNRDDQSTLTAKQMYSHNTSYQTQVDNCYQITSGKR